MMKKKEEQRVKYNDLSGKEASPAQKKTANNKRPASEEVVHPKTTGINSQKKDYLQEAEVDYATLFASYHTTEIELELKKEELGRLQHELDTARDRYYRLFDLAPVGYLILNQHGVIMEINLAAAELLGTTRDRLINKALFQFIWEEDRIVLFRNLREFPGSTANQYLELRLNTRQRRPVAMQLSAVPLEESNPKGPQQFFVSMLDITIQKQAEEVLKRDKETFEKEVETKSRELAVSHEELYKSQRLAEIGSLAAIVAHELRSPLAAINATVYNIVKKESRPEILEKLDKIGKKVAESSHIIDELLSYSRVRTPQYVQIRLDELLSDILKSVQENYRDLNITLTADLEGVKGQALQADAYQISEVFYNILNNAYQSFNPHITHRVINVLAITAGLDVIVIVKDTGPGIPAEDLPRIIEPFFTKKAKGTGLGLAITKEVLAMHGGSLGIQSTVGQGTTVTIKLPLSQSRR